MNLRLIPGMILILALAHPTVCSATTSGSLTLTTYNIHSGIPAGSSSVGLSSDTGNLHDIADVLTTSSGDIIGLQEVRNHWIIPSRSRPGKCPLDMALYLGSLMDMYYCFGSTLDSTSGYPENRSYLQWGNEDRWTNNGAAHGEYGNAILSRHELAVPPTIIKLPRASENTVELPDEARNAIRVELKNSIPGLGRVVVYNTHFQHNNGVTRKAQMAELLRHAKADTTTATVFIMGDLNHYPHKGEPDLLGMVRKAGFHDLAAEFAKKNGTEPAYTMPGKKGNIRIDYILCSKPVAVSKVEVLNTQVSDHLPLAITIDLQ